MNSLLKVKLKYPGNNEYSSSSAVSRPLNDLYVGIGNSNGCVSVPNSIPPLGAVNPASEEYRYLKDELPTSK